MTNAMKRKLGYVLRWEIDDPNDNMSQTTEVEVNDHRFISEQRYQQLEQRHQQLEQVAKDMLHEFENANNLVFNGYTYTALDVIGAAAERYRGRIEDCGVSLDD